MKIAKHSILAVAAPVSMTAADLAVIEGGVQSLEDINKERDKWFAENKPKDGQSRDSYAKQTMKNSDYDRYTADRAWDVWAKDPNSKPGNVT
jgi:hypothetical protein